MKTPPPRNVIFESVQQGRYVKVSAIDAATGFEVSIVGDPRASQETLHGLAMKKLNYVLAKKGK